MIPKYIRHASSIDCLGETVLTSIYDRKIDIYHKPLYDIGHFQIKGSFITQLLYKTFHILWVPKRIVSLRRFFRTPEIPIQNRTLVAIGAPVDTIYFNTKNNNLHSNIRHASSVDCLGETVLASIHDRKMGKYHKLLNR